jgi:regulator of RNase E activity RraA
LRDTNANITANRFVGVTDRADRIRINDAAVDTDPNYRTAKTTAAPTSIAARTSAGNLVANIFQGTATAARYADLAEKYLTDKEYDTGTVVMVGGDAEVTESVAGGRAIGVVSSNPAFMMNKDLEGGTYIALKGRVPVKTQGPVTKGDKLVAHNNGTAIVASASDIGVFAVALETNRSAEVKLVEAVIL